MSTKCLTGTCLKDHYEQKIEHLERRLILIQSKAKQIEDAEDEERMYNHLDSLYALSAAPV